MGFIMRVCTISLLMILLISGQIFGQKKSAWHNLQKANELIDKNEEKQALHFLNECLAQEPDHQEALFLRARIRNNQHQFLEALTDYNAVLSLNPENKEATYSRGVLRYQLEQFEAALMDFKKCLQLPSGGTNTAYFKIDPQSSQASGISTINRMEADLYNHIGLCYYQLGKYNKALESYNHGLEQEKQHHDLLINRALAYEKLEQYDLAKKDYEAILKLSPLHERASINLLRLSTENQKITRLNEYILNHPEQPIGYSDRGLLYFNQGNFKMAEKDFLMATKLDPTNSEIKLNLGLSQIKLNKLEEAEMLLLEVAEIDPDNARAFFNLGNIQYSREHYQEAISYYTIAIQKESNNASFYYNRSLAFYESNQIHEACEDMKLAQSLGSESGKSFINKYCQE
jgi:tetratricopeptide (TPR) repeat protein